MIGGHDISVIGASSAQDIDVLLRAALAAWPSGVLETSDGQLTLSLRQALTHLWPVPSEFFIYENHAAYESWTELGLTDENAQQMLSIVVESDGISFRVNEEGSKTGVLAEELILALRHNRAFFDLRAA